VVFVKVHGLSEMMQQELMHMRPSLVGVLRLGISDTTTDNGDVAVHEPCPTRAVTHTHT
jgi:hypothetical protein